MSRNALAIARLIILWRLKSAGHLEGRTFQELGNVFDVNRSTILRNLRTIAEAEELLPEIEKLLSTTPLKESAMPLYYHIDPDKLAEVTRIINAETDPKVTEDTIQAEICGDWSEGEEHQRWINAASAREIADWLQSFYTESK